MKSLFNLFGIIALLAIIGFSSISCDTGTTIEGESPDTIPPELCYKWYLSDGSYDVLIYEFKENGELWVLDSPDLNFLFTAKKGVITYYLKMPESMEPEPLGTIRYKIDGATLRFSNHTRTESGNLMPSYLLLKLRFGKQRMYIIEQIFPTSDPQL